MLPVRDEDTDEWLDRMEAWKRLLSFLNGFRMSILPEISLSVGAASLSRCEGSFPIEPVFLYVLQPAQQISPSEENGQPMM